VAQWVRLCEFDEAPPVGRVREAEAEGVQICLANVNGVLSALDNICPHRQGPLGQGWIEGEAVICPWHSWAFRRQEYRSIPWGIVWMCSRFASKETMCWWILDDMDRRRRGASR
jgi:nitrite reductase/ring-hydroxylating ferredoxin subunit